jgi:hypothetical protein
MVMRQVAIEVARRLSARRRLGCCRACHAAHPYADTYDVPVQRSLIAQCRHMLQPIVPPIRGLT